MQKCREFLSVQSETNALILNTPNRHELLNDGPPTNCQAGLLGKGAYGTVFKAVYCGKPVAVKIVKNEQCANQQILRNEANCLGWSQPNIMRIFEIESTPKFGIIVMERFAGQCLQSILDTISLPFVHRLYVCLDILSALRHCHEQGVLHLDVKPQNVFVAFSGTGTRKYICKLCDFGASVLLAEEPGFGESTKLLGTVRYMSPEALCASALTPASDVYSLGISMWQLQHQRLPYYWLQCNDIVAYQVVKHGLRPDAQAQSSEQVVVRRGRPRDCRCGSFASENASGCLQHVKAALHEKGLRSLEAVQSHPLTPARRVFRELNLNIDLSTKVTGISPKKQNRKRAAASEHVDTLTDIFQTTICAELTQKQRSFEQMYKKCWHSDARCRPTVAEFRQQVKTFLRD